MPMPDDDELCRLAAEAMQRLNVAWPRATREQKAVWDRDLRIFIDAPPDVADVVNAILYWHRCGPPKYCTFKQALAKQRARKRLGLWTQ
jgi:hypothetical protein